MHILSIHNRYQIRGGEDESSELEAELLREYGHHVTCYEEHNNRLASLSPLHVALRTVWSQESYHRVRQHLCHHPTDLVHVQNFFPLISPSVYYAAQAHHVPVVQSIRNYRLICPNGLFFRAGRVCEDCLGKRLPWPGALHACYRQNHAASATVVAMLTMHRLLRTWLKQVDVFIAISQFARQKCIEAGLPAEKIIVKPNFVHPDPGRGRGGGGYALYVGRLSAEKGMDTLLDAWSQLRTPIPLKIVGDGPLATQVDAAAQRLSHVTWLGRRSRDDTQALMGNAMMLIFPSKWYETFGRVAVEAFAVGTPVIAANLGAIAELVEHGRTGLHFRPGDAADLAAQVEWAMAHPQHLQDMRREARAVFEARYTGQANYGQLMEIYKRARHG
jgi:glycosyltransferase involved in cell wall biosynthesis